MVVKVLELVVVSFDVVEVVIIKSIGLSVFICMCEVENVEFNSDGVLGIIVYCG